MSVYDFSINLIEGKVGELSSHKGEVLLLVNTASKCGFTPQYEGLEKLHKNYAEKGLTVIGFPCNQFGGQAPGSNEEEHEFCQIRYGVTFPLTEKVDVNGENAHPLFKYLTSVTKFSGFGENASLQDKLATNFGVDFDGSSIKWNFTKFLVDREGNVTRYEPTTLPEDLIPAIEEALK
ncbi:MAG: glutathione peroxidase [Bacillales bacterium]|jgi:glutathione peroxidase|nr:glutathione peroxidase [Bacillales bacterium]